MWALIRSALPKKNNNGQNPLYTDIQYNDNCHETFPLEVTFSHKFCKNIAFNTLKKHVLDIC